MLDRLEAIKAKFDEIGIALTNPEVVGDNKRFSQLSKEYRSLEKIVLVYNRYKALLSDIEFNREALMGDDEELRELAKAESAGLEEARDHIEKQIRNMLIPKDPQDDKNVILEIRAGTGGMKHRFLQVICSGCTCVIAKVKGGRQLCFQRTRVRWGASRKCNWRLPVMKFMGQ